MYLKDNPGLTKTKRGRAIFTKAANEIKNTKWENTIFSKQESKEESKKIKTVIELIDAANSKLYEELKIKQ